MQQRLFPITLCLLTSARSLMRLLDSQMATATAGWLSLMPAATGCGITNYLRSRSRGRRWNCRTGRESSRPLRCLPAPPTLLCCSCFCRCYRHHCRMCAGYPLHHRCCLQGICSSSQSPACLPACSVVVHECQQRLYVAEREAGRVHTFSADSASHIGTSAAVAVFCCAAQCCPTGGLMAAWPPVCLPPGSPGFLSLPSMQVCGT
jgi:hypothetical protein